MTYEDFPPIENLRRVLHTCPHSALIYTELWARKRNSKLRVSRSSVQKIFFVSPTLFRNNLFSLQRLELLSFEERIDCFFIDFGSKSDDR